MKKQWAISLCLLSFSCAIMLLTVFAWNEGIRVNLSASLPYMFYRIAPLQKNELPQRGDIVVVDVLATDNPLFVRAIAQGYINPRLPMLKAIGAVPGDVVALRGGLIYGITD